MAAPAPAALRAAAAVAAVAAAVAALGNGPATVKQTADTLTIERTMGENKVDDDLQAGRHREQELDDGPRRHAGRVDVDREVGRRKLDHHHQDGHGQRSAGDHQKWSLAGGMLTIETHERARHAEARLQEDDVESRVPSAEELTLSGL